MNFGQDLREIVPTSPPFRRRHFSRCGDQIDRRVWNTAKGGIFRTIWQVYSNNAAIIGLFVVLHDEGRSLAICSLPLTREGRGKRGARVRVYALAYYGGVGSGGGIFWYESTI